MMNNKEYKKELYGILHMINCLNTSALFKYGKYTCKPLHIYRYLEVLFISIYVSWCFSRFAHNLLSYKIKYRKLLLSLLPSSF